MAETREHCAECAKLRVQVETLWRSLHGAHQSADEAEARAAALKPDATRFRFIARTEARVIFDPAAAQPWIVVPRGGVGKIAATLAESVDETMAYQQDNPPTPEPRP